jgi:hypothetical protein
VATKHIDNDSQTGRKMCSRRNYKKEMRDTATLSELASFGLARRQGVASRCSGIHQRREGFTKLVATNFTMLGKDTFCFFNIAKGS